MLCLPAPTRCPGRSAGTLQSRSPRSSRQTQRRIPRCRAGTTLMVRLDQPLPDSSSCQSAGGGLWLARPSSRRRHRRRRGRCCGGHHRHRCRRHHPQQQGSRHPNRGRPYLYRRVASALFLTAASTSSAWPSGFTFAQIWASFRSGPIRKVVRSMPRTFLPYIFLSFITPN